MEDQLVLGMIWYLVFAASTTVHEAAHAFTSYKLGDWTAYHGGQVTLNPIPHIKREPIGMVVIPWVTFAMAGWMMGWASAPYDPTWAQQYPKRAVIHSLAGPFSNLGLCLIATLLIHLGLITGFFEAPDSLTFSHVVAANSDGMRQGIAVLVSILFSLNLILFIFNMIPIAPLDGQAWINMLLKGELNYKYRMLMMHPNMRFIGIFIAWFIMDIIGWPIYFLVAKSIHLLYGVTYGRF